MGGKVLWQCCLNTSGKAPSACSRCVQCRAFRTSTRTRCQMRSCFGSLCHVHLRRPFYETKTAQNAVVAGVRIAPSRIAGAGLGLFATRDIRYDEPIMQFEYERVSTATLKSRYDYKASATGATVSGMAPYGITIDAHTIADATCTRNAPSFANDQAPHNALIAPSRTSTHAPWTLWLRTKRGTAAQRANPEAVAIREDDEILVSYGARYWKGAGTIDVATRRVPVK